MNVTLKEVREFKYRVNPEERQGAYGFYFVRPFSLYLTFFSLRMGLRANHVTVAQTIAGVAGAACLSFREPVIEILGLLLLQFGFVLDNVDGEIARFRNEASITGKYLDVLGHEYVIPSIFFFSGLGVYLETGMLGSVILGFAAGLASLRLDISSLYHEAGKSLEEDESVRYPYYDDPVMESSTLRVYRLKNQEGPIRILYGLFAYPALMNVLSVCIIARLLGGMWSEPYLDPVFLFMAVYGTLLPVRRVYTIWKIVKGREVEKKVRLLRERFSSKQE